MYPDRAFKEWWVQHKKRPPIQPREVIPILSAMQGHPESPRLWEKHAEAILRDVALLLLSMNPVYILVWLQGIELSSCNR